MQRDFNLKWRYYYRLGRTFHPACLVTRQKAYVRQETYLFVCGSSAGCEAVDNNIMAEKQSTVPNSLDLSPVITVDK